LQFENSNLIGTPIATDIRGIIVLNLFVVLRQKGVKVFFACLSITRLFNSHCCVSVCVFVPRASRDLNDQNSMRVEST